MQQRQVILFALLCCSGLLACTTGVNAYTEKSARIVGGSPAAITSFPYQISLQRNGFHQCSGAIYSAYIVLTAAHCLSDTNPAMLRVRVGSAYWAEGGMLVNVTNFKIHEGFNAWTMENDIAMVRLAEMLPYGPTIRSIALAVQPIASVSIAMVSGWGSTSYNTNQLTRALQATTVYAIPTEQCATNAYAYGSAIRTSMICAGNSGYGACEGDNAAPLVANNILIGLASWGIGCGFQQYPYVFANIAKLSGWVYANAGSMYN